MSNQARKVFVIFIILVPILVSCSPKEWECDNDSNGRKAITKVDTFYYPDRDNKKLDHFIGGNVDVVVSTHCVKGSREIYKVFGKSDLGPFEGWVDSRDLRFTVP
jgi:hypothetical protein